MGLTFEGSHKPSLELSTYGNHTVWKISLNALPAGQSSSPKCCGLIVVLDSVHGHIEQLVCLAEAIPCSIVLGIDICSSASVSPLL